MPFPAFLLSRVTVNVVTNIFNIAGIMNLIGGWLSYLFGGESQDIKIQRGFDNITRVLLQQSNVLTKSLFPNTTVSVSDLKLLENEEVFLSMLKSAGDENNLRNLFLLMFKSLTGANLTPDENFPDTWIDSYKIGQFDIVGISPFLYNFYTKITNIDASAELLKDAFYFIDENEVGISIAELFSTKEFSAGDIDLTPLAELFKITIGENEYNITQVLKEIFTISINPDFSDNIASGFLAVGSRAVDEVTKAF